MALRGSLKPAGRYRNLVSLIALVVATGCAAPARLPRGEQAYTLFPAPAVDRAVQDYRIGPLDKINITVFGEEELTLEEVQVDAGGGILLPLIGSVQAANKTTRELSAEIATRLGERYLENPQVSVLVASSVSQKVIVEGSVNESGVYEIRGRTTLLEALAMAKGTSRVAALKQVAIFRTTNGQRTAALFDVAAIQRGEADDPEIRGNDIVVVGLSNLKAAWRDFLTAAPALAVFQVIRF